MLLILAAMMALTSITGSMNTAAIDPETDGVSVWWKGSVVLRGDHDPEDVWVAVYDNANRLIADCYCLDDYTFCAVAETRDVTDDVRIVLHFGNATRTKYVPDKWGSYTFYPSGPKRYEHIAGTFNFTVMPIN